MAEPSIDRTARTIKRLSVAVWILVFIGAANLAISTLALFAPAVLGKRIIATFPEQFRSSESTSLTEYNSFHEWPLEKKVASASVIVIAKWQKSDSTLKCIIAEILKHSPHAAFYYKVGDEFRPGNQRVKDGASYGDGEIIFFTGSPASFRYGVGFSGDRVEAMGGIPVGELRELIRKSQ